MRHKKIIFANLLLALVVIISVSSCKKFLDRKPLGATLDDYGSVVDGQALGMYVVFNTWAGFNTLPWLDFNSIRDDDAQKGSSTTDGAEINAEFETFQYTKDDWATDTYWNDHYYMINLANKLLYYADSLKLNDAASLRNVAEAHFFRAYSFFELVLAYGQVPLINYYYTKASEGIKPKATIDQIYAQIDADLDSATLFLPASWYDATKGLNPFPGRLTVGAAKALWAKTYMHRPTPNWSKVLSLCNDIINSGQYNNGNTSSIVTNFVDVWKDGLGGAGKNGPESVLEMQAYVGPGKSPDLGSFFGVSQNVRQGGASSSWNLGWGWNTPTDKLVTDWDNSDPRKAMTILYSGQFDGGPATGGYGATLPPYNPGTALDQKYWNKKVYSDPAMRTFIGDASYPAWIDHRVIRYSDVILMKAEAANELGDGATAATMLEQVRARARNGNNSVLPPIAFVSQAQMRTAIKNERRWEFAMEGLRFYDLVRWGDALSVLGPLGYTARCQFYPIPQPAIDLSGGVLVQNPNW